MAYTKESWIFDGLARFLVDTNFDARTIFNSFVHRFMTGAVVAAGTDQAGATLLAGGGTHLVETVPVNSGVRLTANAGTVSGLIMEVYNTGANPLNIYPATDHKIIRISGFDIGDNNPYVLGVRQWVELRSLTSTSWQVRQESAPATPRHSSYISTPAGVALNASTYTNLGGTWTEGSSSDFTLATGTGIVTYTGAEAQRVYGMYSVSAKLDTAAVDVEFRVEEDGTTDVSTAQIQTFDAINKIQNVAVPFDVTLNQNATLNLAALASTGTPTLTADRCHLRMLSVSLQ